MAPVTEETQEWSRVECSEMDQMGLRGGMKYSMTKGQRQFSDKKFSFPQAEAVILFYIQREFKLCPWFFSKYLLRINLNLSTRHRTVSLLENIGEKNLPDIKFDDYFYINNKYMTHEMILLSRTLLMLKYYILWNILWRAWKKSYIPGKCRIHLNCF